jgi:hypothetical protein
MFAATILVESGAGRVEFIDVNGKASQE